MKDNIRKMIKNFCKDIGGYIKFLILFFVIFDILLMVVGGDEISLFMRAIYYGINIIFFLCLFFWFYYPKAKKYFGFSAVLFFIFINIFNNVNDELRWHFDRINCEDMDFVYDEEKKICIIGKNDEKD